VKKILLSLALFLFVVHPLVAANPWTPLSQSYGILKADLPPCTADAPAQNRIFLVKNCTTKISCATTGTEAALLVCDGTEYRAVNATATAADLGDYVLITKAGQQSSAATGAGNDWARSATDDISDTSNDYVGAFVATWGVTAPVSTLTAATSATVVSPIFGVSGNYEMKVANVTVADDAAGTKPTGAIPITAPMATCTCNDATGCTMSIAEPTVTATYSRFLWVQSIGTGNCEIADSSGVVEVGATLVLEPTSNALFGYVNAAWHRFGSTDNVP
jgi:hypothetical protein